MRARSVSPTWDMGWRETARGCRRPRGLVRSSMVTIVTVLVLSGCGGHDNVTGAALSAPEDLSGLDEAEVPGAGFVAPSPIAVVTYDGSGQLVHPDAVVFPRRWQGKRYWVSGTPYPGGNPKYENPSIYQGRASNELGVPLGVTNPIVPAPMFGYLSDPDLLHDPDSDELRMYYRSTSGPDDTIFLITSRDGVLWSPPRLVLSADRHSLISPSIVRESATSWRMWTVNASSMGCLSASNDLVLQQRQSSDGITWSTPQGMALRVPGQVPWHWDVQYVPAKSEYWALVAAYPDGTTCSHTAVYFARSADGTTWDVSPTPLLAPGELEPLRDLVYRSSFHYHDGSDAVSVWFSGARLEGKSFHYSVVSARYPFAELLRRVGGPAPLILERGVTSATTAALTAAREEFERAFP